MVGRQSQSSIMQEHLEAQINCGEGGWSSRKVETPTGKPQAQPSPTQGMRPTPPGGPSPDTGHMPLTVPPLFARGLGNAGANALRPWFE